MSGNCERLLDIRRDIREILLYRTIIACTRKIERRGANSLYTFYTLYAVLRVRRPFYRTNDWPNLDEN